MADDSVEKRLQALERLKTELILDCCSSKLWKEFKTGCKLSNELLIILRDLFMTNPDCKIHEELDKTLHCTRFFCGLSESRIEGDNGSITYRRLHRNSLNHVQQVCQMYPFSSSEKLHFKNIVKVQVVLSAYRAGNIDKAEQHFTDLYDERAVDDEFEEHLDSVDDDRIPCSFLQIYQYSTEVEDDESSWDSIVRGTHPDIKAFKTRDRQKDKTNEPETSGNSSTSKHRNTKNKAPSKVKQVQKNKDSDDNDGLSEDDCESNETKKNKEAISKLKESSKELEEKQLTRRSPFNKKRWNQHHETAAIIEWSDSDEDDNHPLILHLPSSGLPTPKRCLNVSIPKPPKRRKKNPWSDEELSWLCKGVETHGEGQWSAILKMFSFNTCRTGVDLKDKWRNYSKKF
ncbi:hypothetical protein QZH41_019523 [Actinostola sp. cb2023]|nr:hypothetical protein QZH41_019523 [Actinostola sp. cb2023]